MGSIIHQPPQKRVVGVRGLVVGIRRNVLTGESMRLEQHNVVTTAGDQFYSEKVAQAFGGGTPNPNFTRMFLGNAGSPATPGKASTLSALTIVAGSERAFDANYPQNNDPDATNSGAGDGVLTYRVTYPAGVATATGIRQVAIAAAGATGGAALLMYATFAAFDKGANDELVMYVNHTFLGA